MDSADSGRESGEVFRLIYRSRSRILPVSCKAELGTCSSVARSNNKKRSLTGALLVSGDWFAQVLEGEEATVRSLFSLLSGTGGMSGSRSWPRRLCLAGCSPAGQWRACPPTASLLSG